MKDNIESILSEFRAIRQQLDELEALQLDTHIIEHIKQYCANNNAYKDRFQYLWQMYKPK